MKNIILGTFVEYQLAVSLILIRYKLLACEKVSQCRKWLKLKELVAGLF